MQQKQVNIEVCQKLKTEVKIQEALFLKRIHHCIENRSVVSLFKLLQN